MVETQYVLSISYGKDSLACLGAIEQLGLPLDRIIHSEVWATDDIPADPPSMVEFKAKADQIIKERWGIEVEHLCATKDGEKLTYEKLFYHIPNRRAKRSTDDWGGEAERLPAHFPKLVQEAQNRVCAASRSTGGRDTEQLAGRPLSSKQGSILGFPIVRGNWCTSDLKRRVFTKLPCTRSGYKYCAVSRYRC